MSQTKKFTSESVSEGHPDKLADQISDAILDACLSKDSESRVACETYTTTGMVLVGGEISTQTYINVQDIAIQVARDVGYTKSEFGLNCDSMAVLNVIHEQSGDIAQGVDTGGAGDQGVMFGFACKETTELMPAPIIIAHKILRRAAELRKNSAIPWLRPDSKSQVTLSYAGDTPVSVDVVVLSHQHDPSISQAEIEDTLKRKVILPILEEADLSTADLRCFINPTGRFVIGGPHGDAGLTGRKIVVDTYGGMGRSGGGAFSGKDPSKVDRSASYMARYIAKNIVAAELADRVEVQLSYAIGVEEPVSLAIDCFGTGRLSEPQLEKAVRTIFDLTPRGIIRELDLKKPIYRQTTNYGHFGREGFTWEKVDKTDALKAIL